MYCAQYVCVCCTFCTLYIVYIVCILYILIDYIQTYIASYLIYVWYGMHLYRLMETFAQKLFDDLGPKNPFVTVDAAFILSFSTIMLNTDLHNPQIQESKRMKM